MKKSTLILFAATLFLSPGLLFAEEGTTIKVAGFVYPYDEVLAADTNGDGANDRNSYYKDGKLVLSAYDENGDGKDDLWFEWKNDKVTLEMRATSGGGKPDEFIVVDDNENALSIETPEGGGALGDMWAGIILIAVLSGIWWHKKKRALPRFHQ